MLRRRNIRIWEHPHKRLYILVQNGDAQEEVAMCGKNSFIGICALALGIGILITAIFPVGALLFVIAFLLIACGLGCMQR